MRRLLAVTLCAVSLIGCAGLQKREGPPPLKPVASKFKDIPVPSIFKSVPQSTYAFESSIIGIRIGTVKYQGKAPLEQVIDFYKEQMPRYKWILENSLEYGNVMLNFSREKDTCLINLSSQEDLVTIDITLGPKLKQIEQILPK